jgi:hypothetical protein
MKAELLKSTALPIDLVGLAHLSREMTQIVAPGQIVPNRDRICNLVCGGDLQMIQFIRWYCPRPELPALAQALGLTLKEPDRPAPARQSLRRLRRLIPTQARTSTPP